MRRLLLVLGLLGLLAASVAPAVAHAPSGAIFTTLADGSEVNFNHFDAKEDVHLDGGPGPGAPQHAAGLDDGVYVFQVTDPSGKNLLSTDPARCRQFSVAAGIITGVVAQPDGCEHVTGVDVDYGAATVQLMPYLDTPNNGGVYKTWVTRVDDFVSGCQAFGVMNGLDVVDCGNRGGNRHGFVPSHSKTDNFKVDEPVTREIDTRFWDEHGGGDPMDGFSVTWIDTNGASNVKWSYWAPELMVFHEAHVEAVENGVHQIVLADQPGCEIHDVWVDGVSTGVQGPQTVSVAIRNHSKAKTVFIDVDCHTA